MNGEIVASLSIAEVLAHVVHFGFLCLFAFIDVEDVSPPPSRFHFDLPSHNLAEYCEMIEKTRIQTVLACSTCGIVLDAVIATVNSRVAMTLRRCLCN